MECNESSDHLLAVLNNAAEKQGRAVSLYVEQIRLNQLEDSMADLKVQIEGLQTRLEAKRHTREQVKDKIDYINEQIMEDLKCLNV